MISPKYWMSKLRGCLCTNWALAQEKARRLRWWMMRRSTQSALAIKIKTFHYQYKIKSTKKSQKQ